MNHHFKYIVSWHGTYLEQGDSIFFKSSPWGHKWPHPKFYIAKTFKQSWRWKQVSDTGSMGLLFFCFAPPLGRGDPPVSFREWFSFRIG